MRMLIGKLERVWVLLMRRAVLAVAEMERILKNVRNMPSKD